ncbi:hypothetical protein PIB30_006846 [Stylosanthes scabra]|uniref:Uncharacterized protein n=1 Tax=Stylosanthes scabra TaxID=79078 RepID=A0ABU6V550_9FABA|nr:hypothetical protein [Stylosanthes scabra]
MERLNGVMQDVAKNLLKVFEGNVLSMKQVDIMTAEIRKGIVLLDKGMAFFGVPLEEALPTRPVVAFDFIDDSGPSSGNAVTHNDGGYKGKAVDQPMPNHEAATPTLRREVPREVHAPVFGGSFSDQTIVMGPMLQRDITNICKSAPTITRPATSSRLSPDAVPYYPLSLRGRGRGQPGHGLRTYGAAGSRGHGAASRKLARLGDTTNEVRSTGRQRRAPRLVPQPVHMPEKGITFPPYIHSRINITEDMNYQYEEAQAIAFIFGESLFEKAVLFKHCDKTLDREDFLSLHPGNVPSDLFLDLIAQKTTWKQKHATTTCVWSLPLRFSELCLSHDFEASDVVDHYKDSWLPTPTALRHIYVQLKEVLLPGKENHLYLMVVDIFCHKIWLFDCYQTVESVQGRIEAARKVAKVLDFALRVTYNKYNVLEGKPPMNEWSTEMVPGIPNMNSCNMDKIWMLLWLQMEEVLCMTTPAVGTNNIDALSDKIRIDTALALCDHEFHENRDHFKQRAMEDWNGKRACHVIFGD